MDKYTACGFKVFDRKTFKRQAKSIHAPGDILNIHLGTV